MFYSFFFFRFYLSKFNFSFERYEIIFWLILWRGTFSWLKSVSKNKWENISNHLQNNQIKQSSFDLCNNTHKFVKKLQKESTFFYLNGKKKQSKMQTTMQLRKNQNPLTKKSSKSNLKESRKYLLAKFM